MKTRGPFDRLWQCSLTTALAVALLGTASCYGNDWIVHSDDRREPLLPPDVFWRPPSEAIPSPSRPRLRSFCTPYGCTSDILMRADAEAEASTDPALRAGKDADDLLDAHIEV